MLACVDVAHLKVTPQMLALRNYLIEMISAVLDEDTVEFMEYLKLMKNPKYFQLYGYSYADPQSACGTTTKICIRITCTMQIF